MRGEEGERRERARSERTRAEFQSSSSGWEGEGHPANALSLHATPFSLRLSLASERWREKRGRGHRRRTVGLTNQSGSEFSLSFSRHPTGTNCDGNSSAASSSAQSDSQSLPHRHSKISPRRAAERQSPAAGGGRNRGWESEVGRARRRRERAVEAPEECLNTCLARPSRSPTPRRVRFCPPGGGATDAERQVGAA